MRNLLPALLLLSLVLPGTPVSSAADEEFTNSWYPRTATSEKGTAVIHAPQIDAWEDFETISVWQAFSISHADSDATFHGSISYDAETDTDLQEREVLLHDLVIKELRANGMQLGLTVQKQSNAAFTYPYLLHRTMIFGDRDMQAFKKSLVTYKALRK